MAIAVRYHRLGKNANTDYFFEVERGKGVILSSGDAFCFANANEMAQALTQSPLSRYRPAAQPPERS